MYTCTNTNKMIFTLPRILGTPNQLAVHLLIQDTLCDKPAGKVHNTQQFPLYDTTSNNSHSYYPEKKSKESYY